MQVVGADVSRGGWVAIVLEHGRFAGSALEPDVAGLLQRFPDAAVVGVDMPIGLPDNDVRAADRSARAFVGPRRSSVFATPPRRALEAATYAEARALWPPLSAQAFALRAKILEVEEALEDRIIEVHPEVSFAELAGAHLTFSKRTWSGQHERRRLLRDAGIALPDELDAGAAGVDDVLDAAVVAWTANRYARGEALPLPEGANGRGVIWR
jgi:predicted RNase H-like nuclease